jgi:hypothetical protein
MSLLFLASVLLLTFLLLLEPLLLLESLLLLGLNAVPGVPLCSSCGILAVTSEYAVAGVS